MLVNIPFLPEWKDKMLSGQKTCTSRNKKYGQIGDTFNIYGATFELTNINSEYLFYVATSLFKEEGCTTPNEFIEVWERIHPKKGFVRQQSVWVHHFRIKGKIDARKSKESL